MEFNKKQLESINCEDEQVCVIAPPGSGKTSCSVGAILQYNKNHPDHKICFITFTRAAAGEAEQRLAQVGADLGHIRVSTIHSWARDQLIILARQYNFELNVLSETETLDILKDIIAHYPGKTKVKPEILQAYIGGSKNMDVSDGYLNSLKALERRYLKYKEDNNLYDYTDYPKYLLNQLKYYNEYITGIDALFVDELQDVDTEQLEIFSRVFADKKFYIGDPKQSIYIWRNADPKAFSKLDGFTYKELDVNYRSHQEIIDYADSVYALIAADLVDGPLKKPQSLLNFKKSHRSSTKCHRGPGSRIFVISNFGVSNEVNGVTDSAEKSFAYIMKKQPWILCRTNREVKTILQLGYTKVSTIHQAKGLEYDDVIVVDSEIETIEDLNIAYVAVTRAKNDLLITNFVQLYNFMKKLVKNW